MKNNCKYLMLLLVAGLSTGAIPPEPVSPPLEEAEYLDADDWFQAGVALNSEGKYQEAAEAFSKSISIQPGNSASWLNLGTAQALVGEYETAIASLRKSLNLDPTQALAYANLAEVCFRVAKYEEAVSAYTSLLALWPRNANAHYKRGMAYLLLNDMGKAQADYLSLKIIDPDLAEKLLKSISEAAAQESGETR